MTTNGKTSETALVTASLRALSNYETLAQVNCQDDLAELFLPDERKSLLATPDSRDMIKQKIPPGMYEYVIARTKYFDAVFSNALQSGIAQIVFLGAGYDSRPYRFSHFIQDAKIYEVDTAATQKRKQFLLQQNRIDIHQNIFFVAVDFETDNLIRLLRNDGFDTSQQTLFVWEGVTFYLSYLAVIGMLKTIKENSPAGSQVCFDFQTIRNHNDLIDTGLKDETIRFGIPEAEIGSFVANNHYAIVEHLNSTEIEKRFLTFENGTVFGKIMPRMNFILIEHP